MVDQSADTARRRSARIARKRDRTQQDILEAARTILLSKGVSGTTLEAVAHQAGMSKTAIYYYFPSKDAMLFELVYGIISRLAEDTHIAVNKQHSGAEALSALIRTTISSFGGRMDDFRLAYLQSQLSEPGSVMIDKAQLDRVRPLNNLAYAGTSEKIAASGPNRAGVEPRLMAFLAQVSALGVLTMKGMVESIDDPLVYSDQQLSEALSAIFAAAAGPASAGNAHRPE